MSSSLFLVNLACSELYNFGQIKLMQKKLTPEERLAQNRNYIIDLLQNIRPHAYPLNAKLASNPFLKNEDKFQFILYQINQYNKRVEKIQVTDPYEMASYQKLHSMVSDLAQMETKIDQLDALTQVYDWYKQQTRLVEQRKDQGEIRYLVTNNYRKYVRLPLQKDEQEPELEPLDIPTELVDRLMEPFRFGNRTTHKQLEIPLRRLNQYKRKVINIAPFIDNKEAPQPPRVFYPVPPKYEPKEEEDEQKEGQEGEQKQQMPNIEGAQGENPQPQEEQNKNHLQMEQDLGLPQDPEDIEEEQPEEVDDKLAPKNKLFTEAVSNRIKQRVYKSQYMPYSDRQTGSQVTLEQRYLKLQQQTILRQREDKINIQLATERAKKKSKINKDIQKKLEDMLHQPKYSFSLEETSAPERLSRQDELRFGFTTNVRVKPKLAELDLSNNTLHLPKINDDTFSERSIRKDRLKSLKSKFGKMLNLSEYEERETAVSMCQYTARRRGLSQIIRNHSKSKERLHQLQEVGRIKERLTRNKIGINIRALSQGLCIPESQDDREGPQNIFPGKQLPSNPFMVDTKKKKKKKK